MTLSITDFLQFVCVSELIKKIIKYFKIITMANYFNTLPLREQLNQLGVCEFMDNSEFADGVEKLKGKKIVIVGCGAQGLNQGLNMRDSGLDVSYTLRPAAIAEKRQSWKNATENNFAVGTYEK